MGEEPGACVPIHDTGDALYQGVSLKKSTVNRMSANGSGSISNPKMDTGRDSSIVSAFEGETSTKGLGSSENGGDDQVCQPLGTGLRLFKSSLKVTVRSSSEIEGRSVPKGTLEKSILVVAAKYAASGLSMGVALSSTSRPSACAIAALERRLLPTVLVPWRFESMSVHLLTERGQLLPM